MCDIWEIADRNGAKLGVGRQVPNVCKVPLAVKCKAISGVIRCISDFFDFHERCILKTAGCRVKLTRPNFGPKG